MKCPDFFIVGAPRCGTTSLASYLGAHPQVFMCHPKEPYHFCADLPRQYWIAYADRERYIKLFDMAGDRLAGEATTHYLYSETAAEEILGLNPDAKIIIMLRDPVEMVISAHTHGVLWGYENIADLELALNAEDDRSQGRRISRLCLYPTSLRYTFMASYNEHVRRYLDIFGRERVRVVLFDDLKTQPEKVYRETLDFLNLEVADLPDFKVHNAARRWRSPWVARIGFALLYPANRYWAKNPSFHRKVVLVIAYLLFRVQRRFNRTYCERPNMPLELKQKLRELFRKDVQELEGLIEMDLSSWMQS